MIEVERKTESKTEFVGKIISVRTDKVEFENGDTAFREVCTHNGGVAVLAVDGRGNCAVVKQYRYVVDEILLEIPAGKLDAPDENHREAALRELREETGVIPDELVYLGFVYSSPGFLTEKNHLYFASGLHLGQQDLDDGEHLDFEWINLDKLKAMISEGSVTDSKTIAAVYRAELKGLL